VLAVAATPSGPGGLPGQQRVLPDVLLEYVVKRHGDDVREIDLSMVPFNKDTCREPGSRKSLVREVFRRCPRLEWCLTPFSLSLSLSY
jgi:hypothetical protein